VARAYAEASQSFRHLAATRYSLNVRKGYTRAMSSGKWLIEEMAEETGGTAARLHAKDISLYPGSGTVLSELDPRNALDFSTRESSAWYRQNCPWLGVGLETLPSASIYLFRGFMAIARSFETSGEAPSGAWRTAVIDGHPYAALWFNDHFHNNRLPEVRMWLVPEKIFYDKMQFALGSGIDPNLIDLTPEGIAEAAHAAKLPILSVGTSSVLFGSFANARPFGSGSAHGDWESTGHPFAAGQFQDPFHIHRAVSYGYTLEMMTDPIGNLFARVRREHEKIRGVHSFFQDIHSTYLSIEEAWAKEYARSGEKPAKLDLPPPHRQGGGGAGGAGAGQGRKEGDREDSSPFAVPLARTRILEAFLELRNKVIDSDPGASPKQFPTLELQYTRLFARQEETPILRGSDLSLWMPGGEFLSLTGEKPRKVVRRAFELDERSEALWLSHFVSYFKPMNCPRIIMP
jgi:hypothetical protein